MHQAESSSSLFCLWTGHSLQAALHPASRRRSCLPLRTDQCFCPIGTFTLLLVRTLRRTPLAPLALRKTCPNSSRSIILDFWLVVVGSKPEELAPQTSHRAWHREEPCR